MDKKYLNRRGLATLLGLIKFGHKKIWHGTLAEWEALTAEEKAEYDQAEVIDEYTGVPVVVDKVEAGNLNPVTSNAVAEAIAAGDWVDVSSSVANYRDSNPWQYTGTPVVRYKKLGPHLLSLDCRFSILYTTAIAAGTVLQEDFIKFNLPADVVHGDTYIALTGYMRSTNGLITPFLTRKGQSGNVFQLGLSVKVIHTSAVQTNNIREFNIQAVVAVDKWLA